MMREDKPLRFTVTHPEYLTAEEAELADQWDEQVNAGFAALITRIHELEREV